MKSDLASNCKLSGCVEQAFARGKPSHCKRNYKCLFNSKTRQVQLPLPPTTTAHTGNGNLFE